MGGVVGAIPSAVGGRSITLSHVGKVFDLTTENLRRWRDWWRYIRRTRSSSGRRDASWEWRYRRCSRSNSRRIPS